MQHRLIGRAIVLVALVSLVGACGGSKGVGGGLKDVDGDGVGAIDQTTLTTVAPTTLATTATTAKANVTTTVVTPAVAFSIYPDTAQGHHFIEPLQPPSVRVNQLIRFTNMGATNPAPVITILLDGTKAAESPTLGANAVYDVRLTRPGTYQITDSSRPYATGINLTVNP